MTRFFPRKQVYLTLVLIRRQIVIKHSFKHPETFKILFYIRFHVHAVRKFMSAKKIDVWKID